MRFFNHSQSIFCNTCKAIDKTGGPELNRYGLIKKPHYAEYYDGENDNDSQEVIA